MAMLRSVGRRDRVRLERGFRLWIVRLVAASSRQSLQAFGDSRRNENEISNICTKRCGLYLYPLKVCS